MLENFRIWERHFKNIVEEEVEVWNPSSAIDLDEGNPILALYNPSTLKAVRIIQGSLADRDPYGMWVKHTSVNNLPDDSILEYVFKYREADNGTLEAFRIFLTVWIDKNTDYDYMKCLIEKFQRSAYH